jgi:hypothetical protein
MTSDAESMASIPVTLRRSAPVRLASTNSADAEARIRLPSTVSVPIRSPPPGATIAATTVVKGARSVPDPESRPERKKASRPLSISPSTLVQPCSWLYSPSTVRLPPDRTSNRVSPSRVMRSIVTAELSVVRPGAASVTS